MKTYCRTKSINKYTLLLFIDKRSFLLFKRNFHTNSFYEQTESVEIRSFPLKRRWQKRLDTLTRILRYIYSVFLLTTPKDIKFWRFRSTWLKWYWVVSVVYSFLSHLLSFLNTQNVFIGCHPKTVYEKLDST